MADTRRNRWSSPCRCHSNMIKLKYERKKTARWDFHFSSLFATILIYDVCSPQFTYKTRPSCGSARCRRGNWCFLLFFHRFCLQISQIVKLAHINIIQINCFLKCELFYIYSWITFFSRLADVADVVVVAGIAFWFISIFFLFFFHMERMIWWNVFSDVKLE